MNDLKSRVIDYCNNHDIPDDHVKIYLENLNPEAITNSDLISNDQIHRQINCRELFWGLSTAIGNYLLWEKKQI